jgi:hypothetical protein
MVLGMAAFVSGNGLGPVLTPWRGVMIDEFALSYLVLTEVTSHRGLLRLPRPLATISTWRS